jgi:hypothetical protein
LTDLRHMIEHPEVTDARERDVLGLTPLPEEPHTLPVEQGEGALPETSGLKKLSPRELVFLDEYGSGRLTAPEAYAKAFPTAHTYSSQRTGAHRLLRIPRVQEELARMRAEARAELHYSIVEATKEIDEKIAGAEKAGQWSAVSNLMQTKMKLHALLVDRAEVKQSSFSLHIVEPGAQLPAPPSGNVIDVTPMPDLLEGETQDDDDGASDGQ